MTNMKFLVLEILERRGDQPHKARVENINQRDQKGYLACFDDWNPQIGHMYQVAGAKYDEGYNQWLAKIENILPLGTDPAMEEDIEEVSFSKSDALSVVPKEYTNLQLQEETMDKWNYFNWLKKELVSKSDYQEVKGKSFMKKSGFRKLSQGFRLKLEELSCTLEVFDPPLKIRVKEWNKENKAMEVVEREVLWQYTAKVRVHAPDNAYVDGSGIVSDYDKGNYWTTHDAQGKALTRAYNRAIADLVGYGISSAEDMT